MKLKEHFLSEEKIIADLHEIIGYEKCCELNINHIIKKIAFFYINYQNNIETLFNDKISFKFYPVYIYLNDVFLLGTVDNYFYYNFYEYKDDNDKTHMIIHGGTKDEMPTVAPLSLTDIVLNFKEINFTKSIEILIKQYLHSHMSLLDGIYLKEILKITNFLIPLVKTIIFLRAKKIDIDNYFESEKNYSKVEIYNILKDNEDQLLLSHDINIEKLIPTLE